jgi:hypothetical protein
MGISLFVLLIILNGQITTREIKDDAHGHMVSALNIFKFQIFSKAKFYDNEPEPNNFTEPFFPFVVAGYLWFRPDVSSATLEIEHINNPEINNILKTSNLIWAFFCLLGVWLITWELTDTFAWGFLTVIATNFLFVFHKQVIDSMLTELPAATLITLASLFFILAIKNNRAIFFGVTGVIVGFLGLTRASFFYIAIGVYGFSIALFLVWGMKEKIRGLVLMFIVNAIIIFPWMIRNQILFDHFSISQRGGSVLLARAYKDEMTNQEIMGSFFYWGPQYVTSRLLQPFMGFEKDDLSFGPGNDLERLNRASELSFYQEVKHRKSELIVYYQTRGFPNAENRADSDMQREALDIILGNPGKHLLMSIPFAWRSIWDLKFQNVVPYTHEINFLLYIGLTFVVPMIAFIKKDKSLFAFMIFPLGLLAFYSLFTHNIPRYSRPLYPAKIIGFAIGIDFIGSKLITWLKSKTVDESSESRIIERLLGKIRNAGKILLLDNSYIK